MDGEEIERLQVFKTIVGRITRCAGFVATVLFFGIFACSQSFTPRSFIRDMRNINCLQTELTNEIRTEVVKNAKVSHEGIYSIVEFKLFDESLEYNGEHVAYHKRRHMIYKKPRDIPVLLMPQLGDPTNFHVPLAKVVNSRTRDSEFRFRWFTLTFFDNINKWYPTGFDYYGAALTDVADFFRRVYSSQKPVLLGRGFAASRALSYALSDHMRNITNAPDLVILEATSHRLPGYYDREMNQIIEKHTEQWISKSGEYPIGVVSFEAGLNDTHIDTSLSMLPNVENMPIWTIEEVPDTGLSSSAMSKCEPLLNTIADLLILYGERDERRSGKSIVNSFYQEWENKKRGPLPANWKQDYHQESLRIQIGKRYRLVVNGSSWIDVDVQRNSSLVLQITGSCLKAATIIRSQKFIDRKESLAEFAYFEFGIYDVKPFEDVKIYLESSKQCRVTVETSPWYMGFAQKFYDGFVPDSHNFWVGAQLTLTFLISLEADKEFYRLEHQLYAYIAFILAVLYHTFHTFGVPSPGIFCGAGFSIAVHFISDVVNILSEQQLQVNSDLVYNQLMYHDVITFLPIMYIVFVPALLDLFPSNTVAQLFITKYSSDVRAFLGQPMMFTMQQRFYLDTNSTVYGIPYRISFVAIAIIAGCILTNPELLTLIGKMHVFIDKFINKVNNYLPSRFTRSHFHCWGYLALGLDFIMASNSLDWHYAVAIGILLFNRFCDTFNPRGLQDYPISPLAWMTRIIKTENVNRNVE